MARVHNAANELSSRTPVTGGVRPMTYDAAGNMRTAKPINGGTVTDHTYTHDAWNRLVKVEQTIALLPPQTRTVGVYRYNGLHWRTVSDVDAKTPVGLDQRRTMYYSAAWQILTEEVDDYTNTTGPHDTPSPDGVNHVAQQLWGLRYIDDAVLRRLDRDADGLYSDEDDSQGTQRSYWHITDPQFSTVAMVGRYSTNLMERISYDSYGRATHRWPGDVNNDGSVNSTDGAIIDALAAANGGAGTLITDSAYNADAAP